VVYPQLVVFDSDGWVAKQLAELAGESRWLMRQPRTRDSTLALFGEQRPTVLFIRVDPSDENDEALALLTDVHRRDPDAAIVAVSAVKLPDADRATWTALLFDLGARYVLFPPLTKPVLEDLASGLMASAVRRVMGDDAVSGRLPAEADRPGEEPPG